MPLLKGAFRSNSLVRWPDAKEIASNRMLQKSTSVIVDNVELTRWIRGFDTQTTHTWLRILAQTCAKQDNLPSSADWASAFSPPPATGKGWETFVLTAILIFVAAGSIFGYWDFWRGNQSWLVAIMGLFSLTGTLAMAYLVLSCSRTFMEAGQALLVVPIIGAVLTGTSVSTTPNSAWLSWSIGWIPFAMAALSLYGIGMRLLCSNADRGYGPALPPVKAVLGSVVIVALILFVSFAVSFFFDGRIDSVLRRVAEITCQWFVVLLVSLVISFRSDEGKQAYLLGPVVALIICVFFLVVAGTGLSFQHGLMHFFGFLPAICLHLFAYFVCGLVYGSWWRRWKMTQNPLRPIARHLIPITDETLVFSQGQRIFSRFFKIWSHSCPK